MTTHTLNTGLTLYVQCCITCGVPFGMPNDLDSRRREDHRNFYCPNGHQQHYTGETDAEKYRRLYQRERDARAAITADLDQSQASLRATKGVVTRQRKRLEKVVAGVCPVDGCHRHFADVRKHIATKHPDWEGGVG